MKELFIICCISLTPFFVFGQLKKTISRLEPHHAKIQFAGSIGFLSGGFGYESANRRMQYDFFYGYVPEKFGSDAAIHSVTGKLTWTIFSKQLQNELRLAPFTTGFLVNYAFGKQYFLFTTPNYPGFYYGFPTAAHIGIFIGGSITKNKLGLYYEIGTHVKDLSSYVVNTRTLDFVDILNIGIGTRIALHKTTKKN